MTNAHEESRTLVKSPPELWAELSDVTSLSRHLHEFGEIRITRLEPETAVAWEGERASGTVRLEPSGWGTKVILTAQASAVTPDPPISEAPPEREPAPLPPDPPVAEAPPQREPPQREPAPEPAPPPQPAPPPSPAPMPPAPARAARQPRSGLFGRLFGLRNPLRPVEPPPPPRAPRPHEPKPEPTAEPKPAPTAAAPPAPEPTAATPPAPEPTAATPPAPEPTVPPSEEPDFDAAAILTAALDSLGQAHHRPFSRA
jgi:hypothetical protein